MNHAKTDKYVRVDDLARCNISIVARHRYGDVLPVEGRQRCVVDQVGTVEHGGNDVELHHMHELRCRQRGECSRRALECCIVGCKDGDVLGCYNLLRKVGLVKSTKESAEWRIVAAYLYQARRRHHHCVDELYHPVGDPDVSLEKRGASIGSRSEDYFVF